MLKSLVSVLAGNAIFFLVLTPLLPHHARHVPGRLDLGLVIDFWVCLVMYGLLEFFLRRRRRAAARH